MIKVEFYKSEDGKFFEDKESCQKREDWLKDIQERLADIQKTDETALELLKNDLTEARKRAYNPEVIDTFGAPQARAIYYMKNVCSRFLEKYSSITMI